MFYLKKQQQQQKLENQKEKTVTRVDVLTSKQ